MERDMVAIRTEHTALMDGMPGDAQEGSQDKIAKQIGHLQDQNVELEQRCKALEGKLDEVLKLTGAHAELIQGLREENEALKAVLGAASLHLTPGNDSRSRSCHMPLCADAWQALDHDTLDENGEDGDDHTAADAESGSAASGEGGPNQDNPNTTNRICYLLRMSFNP